MTERISMNAGPSVSRPKAAHPKPHAQQARPARQRILVVDDDESTRRLNSLLLSRIGYDVDAAENGEQAWRALLSNGYDLLITDHNMPELTGLELVARMRAAGMILPAIIDSAAGELGETFDYPQLELAAVLHKSLACTDLIDAVKRVLPLPSQDGEGTIRTTAPEPSNIVRLPHPCGPLNSRPAN